MTRHILSIGFCGLLWSATAFGQERDAFSRDFETVRKDLVAWDPIRGEWLANSMVAMANQAPIPDRQFPENFTPAEMFSVLPDATRSNVRTAIQTNATNADSSSRQRWNSMNQFAQRPSCKPLMGRSYGDPHLQSFDGATYSFQTVGEFTLVKSQSGHMNVQVRQRNEGNDFSLNSAVAMWVAGDRVCLYANERPDGNNTTPLRVDGDAVYVEDRPFFLEHGGIIRKEKDDYIVTWPTGERVKLDMRGFNTTGFMNVAVEVFPCTDEYNGILGNANGRSNDDFDLPGNGGRTANMNFGVFGSSDPGAQAMEREYLAYIAKDFGRSWRISQGESLFDYGWGQSTLTFTDESFPRVHHTLGDMNTRDRDRARRDCERQGLTGAELNACVFDGGFLRIPPTPKPVIPRHTDNVVIKPLPAPTPNVNPGRRPSRQVNDIGTPIRVPDNGGNGTAQPLIKNPNNDTEGTPSRGVITEDPNTKNGLPKTEKEPVILSPATNNGTDIKQEEKPSVYYPPVEEDKPRKPIFNAGSMNPSTPSTNPVPSRQPNTTPVPSRQPNSTPAPAKQPSSTPIPSKQPSSTPSKQPATTPNSGGKVSTPTKIGRP